MTTKLCVYLDAGHGGLDPNGAYTTAPSKMFFHSEGTFHNGGYFYEGVFNRQLTNRVAEKLDNLGIPNLIISHKYLDLSLQYRAETANWYHKNYKKGIFVSNHANASRNHSARGFEVYTTPGKTKSDRFADILYKEIDGLLGNKIRMRSDKSDGDYDKEANFYVLRKTAMPAILVEHLFFDNFDDAKLLMDEFVIEMFAEAQVRAIIKFLEELG